MWPDPTASVPAAAQKKPVGSIEPLSSDYSRSKLPPRGTFNLLGQFSGYKMGSLDEEDDSGAYSSLLPWELGSFEDDFADFEPEDTCIHLHLHIAEAKVTGFATQKYEKGERPTDFAFVIEVLWSDGRSSVVKRTFNEFCNFHNYLVDEFAHISPKENPMKLSLFLPGKCFTIMTMLLTMILIYTPLLE